MDLKDLSELFLMNLILQLIHSVANPRTTFHKKFGDTKPMKKLESLKLHELFDQLVLIFLHQQIPPPKALRILLDCRHNT